MTSLKVFVVSFYENVCVLTRWFDWFCGYDALLLVMDILLVTLLFLVLFWNN